MREILNKIYNERGFDFRQYKETTLKRRIQKRLRALKIETYDDYITVLNADPKEYDKLIDVFLINVTEFLRDKEAFDFIKQNILPNIIENRTNKLKIWSAGCASGEEVYSIAMVLDEVLQKDDFEIHIYGTDIDKTSLIKAEKAEYKFDAIESKIPDEVKDKYFNKNSNMMEIKDFVKKNCFFMHHDLVSDRPFNEVDLILCRNVAIYFERPLQEKIYMDFYNALNEQGYLFLGKAETLIGPARKNFKIIDKRWRVYQKKG